MFLKSFVFLKMKLKSHLKGILLNVIGTLTAASE